MYTVKKKINLQNTVSETWKYNYNKPKELILQIDNYHPDSENATFFSPNKCFFT